MENIFSPGYYRKFIEADLRIFCQELSPARNNDMGVRMLNAKANTKQVCSARVLGKNKKLRLVGIALAPCLDRYLSVPICG
jgi:hypothetical protein